MDATGPSSPHRRLPRRRALAQMGLGLGAAWAAPTLTTRPAAAAGSPLFPPTLPLDDQFAREDASSLGSTETGQHWTTHLDSEWGVVSGQAAMTSTGYGIATVNTIVDDPDQAFGYLVVDVSVATGEFWVVFRFSDSVNYWRFGAFAGGEYQLFKIVNDSPTGPITIPGVSNTVNPLAGDRIIIRLLSDDSIDACVQPALGAQVFVTGAGDLFNLGTDGIGFAAQGSPPTVRFERIQFYPGYPIAEFDCGPPPP